jgi:CRP/FNR family transcriptional regulator, transcriptional activator FtrB
MRDIAEGDLRRIALFAEISDDCCGALLDNARLESRTPRTTLLEEGERPRFLQILVEGEVELFAQFNDHETTISVLRPTSVLNLAAAIDDVPNATSGRTRQKSRLLTISAEAVRSAFDHDRIFARAVAHELSLGYCELMLDHKNKKLLTCLERLANWLLRTDAQSGGSGQFMLPFDKRLLASQLGMTPENLSRSLRLLSGHGARISGRNVNLTDPAALTAIAHATSPSPSRERNQR